MTNVDNEASKASLYFTKQLFCMHGYYQGACVLFCRWKSKLIFSDFKSKHLEQLLLESVEAEEVSLANQ